MTRECALGLDLGTSGLKAVLLAPDGEVIARAQETYDVVSAAPGWAETDPEQWEVAARSAIKKLTAQAPDAQIIGIGLDGQMHGLVLADGAGQPVRPAVLWPDTRAVEIMDRYRALEPERLRALSNPVTPGMTGPALAWLTQHRPDEVAQAKTVLLPKDWLRSRLIPHSWCTDPTDASATLLWDVVADNWADDVVDALGINRALLPPVQPSTAVAGQISSEVAASWGLPTGTVVSVGSGDVAATLVGDGASPDRLSITVGSGAQVVLPGIVPTSEGPISHHTYRAADESWYAMVAVMNAGIALGRVNRLLAAGWQDLYQEYDRSRAIPGFLPFLSGERLPTSLPSGSGAWYDIGMETERADLLAAAVEGVVFSIYHAVCSLPGSDGREVELSGGGARHEIVVQMLADLLGRPLRRTSRPDSTAIGAARIGFAASGVAVEPVGDQLLGAASSRPSAQVITPGDPGPLERRYERFLEQAAAVLR